MEKKKQVSLLPYDRVKEYFTQAGEPIIYGRFGENLVVDGMDWKGIHTGDYFCCEDVALEVMKIGAGGPASDAYTGEKVCSPMEPYFIFCRIVQGGILEEGEPIYHT
jgi:TatD DNase family protein